MRESRKQQHYIALPNHIELLRKNRTTTRGFGKDRLTEKISRGFDMTTFLLSGSFSLSRSRSFPFLPIVGDPSSIVAGVGFCSSSVSLRNVNSIWIYGRSRISSTGLGREGFLGKDKRKKTHAVCDTDGRFRPFVSRRSNMIIIR